mmetsp:Transcript_10835/g.16340  ORF Transcript_10835/g.16340 Transcript_10835/m.16340 type:complete len:110 (-) Transcript_10835:1322-1651(-)
MSTLDDPLEPNRRCIKAKTGKLKDPVHIDAQKAEAESSMLGSKVKNGTQKLCKETLNVELWGSGKIEGTPYGSFAKMMDSNLPAGGEVISLEICVLFLYCGYIHSLTMT